MQVDTSDRKQQRSFGLTMAGAIAVVGMIRWSIHWYRGDGMPPLPMWFFAVAAVFGVLGVCAPGLLRPVFVGWMKLALVLNWVMTHVLLTLVYLGLITPVAWVRRMLRLDALNRQRKSEAETYWEEAPEQPDDLRSYLNQF